MIQQQQQIQLLLERGICKTEFATIPISANNNRGVPLGQGRVKAIILRLNKYERNSVNGTAIVQTQVYYGDESRQEYELIQGVDSNIIFCTDLQEVYIRTPADVTIQVLIYTDYEN
jgi:hypothetical protein